MTKQERIEAVEELRRQVYEILVFVEDLKICSQEDLAGDIDTIDMALSALTGDLSDFKEKVL